MFLEIAQHAAGDFRQAHAQRFRHLRLEDNCAVLDDLEFQLHDLTSVDVL